MAPRGYAATAIMIFAMSSFPFAVLWSWLAASIFQRQFREMLPVGLGVGFLFGLLFALILAFFLKAETARFEIEGSTSFKSRLDVVMAELGFSPASRHDDLLVYKPSFQLGMAAGNISVQLRRCQVVVVGPKMYVRKLLKELLRTGNITLKK